MSKVDEFYPIDNDFSTSPLREMGYIIRINENLRLAKAGDRVAESKLCNRIGTLRRSLEIKDMSPDLQNAVKDAVAWLRATGRKIDFTHNDPAMWITTRDGNPRF
jgi:Asp-tRNA(Asn)/Glu-tRNA(Gln) amidotransferase A subunit family amidase